MSDYINKDAFVKNITERYCSGCNDHFGVKCKACWVDDMLGEIDDAPVTDITHCKDCKWHIQSEHDEHPFCDMDEICRYTPDCGYCYWGRRKEN